MVHAAAAPRWFSYRWDSFLLLTTVGHTEVFLRHVLHRAEQPLRCLLVHLKVGDRAAALAPVAREAARDVALNAHARLIYVTRVIARGRGRVWARVPIYRSCTPCWRRRAAGPRRTAGWPRGIRSAAPRWPRRQREEGKIRKCASTQLSEGGGRHHAPCTRFTLAYLEAAHTRRIEDEHAEVGHAVEDLASRSQSTVSSHSECSK